MGRVASSVTSGIAGHAASEKMRLHSWLQLETSCLRRLLFRLGREIVRSVLHVGNSAVDLGVCMRTQTEMHADRGCMQNGVTSWGARESVFTRATDMAVEKMRLCCPVFASCLQVCACNSGVSCGWPARSPSGFYAFDDLLKRRPAVARTLFLMMNPFN